MRNSPQKITLCLDLFYSGRGAITCDLNSKQLETIYGLVKREYGDKVSRDFVRMVADIPKLTATDFLLTFYRLESGGWQYAWKWDKKKLGKEKGIYVDGEDDEKKYASGMATVIGVLGGMSDRDETNSIRGEFLRNHEKELTKTQKRRNNKRDFWIVEGLYPSFRRSGRYR